MGKGHLKFNLPSKEELEKIGRREFEEGKTAPNMLSFWFPKIKDCGIKVPETIIVQLDYDWYKWLKSDDYKPEKINEFNEFLIGEINKTGFNTNRDLFVKTGNYSGKFLFKFPKVPATEYSSIGEHVLNIFYDSMVVGCPLSSEIVVREFIHTHIERGTIYMGMPLNTEFRIFYDFDNKKILGCFNYWDTTTMLENLRNRNDKDTFEKYAADIEKDFETYKKEVIHLSEQHLKDVNLQGKWSVDFMKCGDEYYLIDMALAETSYYFEKLSQ